MTHEDVMNRLKEMMVQLRPETQISFISEETHLVDELGMDSLTLLIMALQAEKTFGIRFENMHASAFQTVGDVCAYIEGKL